MDNMGWGSIIYIWVGFFKIFFIPMLLIPLFLVPSFYLIKRREIVKKARFVFLSMFFSYLFIITTSFMSVYAPINTLYRYATLWLFELSGAFFIVLVLFRRQAARKPIVNLFSNRNVAIGIFLFFSLTATAFFAVKYIPSNDTYKIDENILVIEIGKAVSDTEKRVSFIKENLTADSIVLVKIDSHGGRVSEVIALSDILFELENRSLCYIEGDCFKGAVFIALSCDAIVMHQNSKIGNLAPSIQNVGASTAEVIVTDLKKTALELLGSSLSP